MEKRKTKVLAVCAVNYGRSPTLMDLVNMLDGYDARSCGVYGNAVVVVTYELLEWADVIFVMEDYMKNFLANFTDPSKIHVLNIPDRFMYGSKMLINILSERLLAYGIDTTRVKDNVKLTRPYVVTEYDDDLWESVWESPIQTIRRKLMWRR